MARWILMIVLAPALFGQSPDTVLTQTLINEIRALRGQLEATTVTSQRVQITLYRLQSQTLLLESAQRRLDAARTKVSEAQANRRHMADEIQAAEEQMRNSSDAAERKRFEAVLPRMKAEAESIAAEEAQRRTGEADADLQVKTEQGKLADLQSLLERLDRALDELSRTKK
jgi:hypothetical protein